MSQRQVNYIVYIPTIVNIHAPHTEDILRARIRTIGVEEHRLVMESREHYS